MFWKPRLTDQPAVPEASRPRAQRTRNPLVLGPTLRIDGDLTVRDDVIVHARVDGTVRAAGHTLTIGKGARVMGDIYAATVVVKGSARGNVTAERRIEVASTGTVLGDLCAPQVKLADGSSFSGTINKDDFEADLDEIGWAVDRLLSPLDDPLEP